MVDEATKTIRELDVVVITQDIPEHGLISGDVGTVVHCYGDGEAYEVGVVAANGHTVALMTLSAGSVRLKRGWEITLLIERLRTGSAKPTSNDENEQDDQGDP